MSDAPLQQPEVKAIEREPRANPRGAHPRQADAPTTGERLTRRRHSADPFYIDPKKIPAQVSYEWKRESVHGWEHTEHMIALRENHWQPVPASRHPELAASGASVIRRGGTILCERPKYLTQEAQEEDLQDALAPLRQMEEVMFGTKPNQLTRDHPSVRNSSYVRQKYSPTDVVIDEGSFGEP